MGQVLFGVNVRSGSEQLAAQVQSPLKTTFTLENPDEVKAAQEALRTFNRFSVTLFRNVVFEIHKYLIRVSPMHTGKFRGGWTGFLDKFQQDYSRQMLDTSLYDAVKKGNITPEHRDYAIDTGAIGAGKAFSSIEDKTPGELVVTIENKAPYGNYLEYEKGGHFAARTQYIGELWMQKHFELWIENITKVGKIIPPPPVEEITS